MSPRPGNPTEIQFSNNGQKKLFQEWKTHVENLLMVSQTGIEMYRVEQDLADYGCGAVPYLQMGFGSWVEFLYAIRDILNVTHFSHESLKSTSTRLFLFINNQKVLGQLNNDLADIAEMVHGQRQPIVRTRWDGTTNTPKRWQVRMCSPSELLKRRPLRDPESAYPFKWVNPNITKNETRSAGSSRSTQFPLDIRMYSWTNPNSKKPILKNQQKLKVKSKNPPSKKESPVKLEIQAEIKAEIEPLPKLTEIKIVSKKTVPKIKPSCPYSISKMFINNTINRILTDCQKQNENCQKLPRIPPTPQRQPTGKNKDKDNAKTVQVEHNHEVNLQVDKEQKISTSTYDNPCIRVSVRKSKTKCQRFRDVPSPPRKTAIIEKDVFFKMPPEKMRNVIPSSSSTPRLGDVSIPASQSQTSKIQELCELMWAGKIHTKTLFKYLEPLVFESEEKNLTKPRVEPEISPKQKIPKEIPKMIQYEVSVSEMDKEILFPDFSLKIDSDTDQDFPEIETKSSKSSKSVSSMNSTSTNDEDRVQRIKIDPGFIDEETILNNRYPIPRPTPEAYLQPRQGSAQRRKLTIADFINHSCNKENAPDSEKKCKCDCKSSKPVHQQVERVKRINFNEL